jgi:hypothetical protein
MRAREFVVVEVLGLAAMLGNKPAAPGSQPPAQTPKNVNATVTPVGTQGGQVTATPASASAQQTPGGGTQTPQDGVNTIPSTGSAAGATPGALATSALGTPAAVPGTAIPAQKYQPGQQIDLPGLGKVKVGATTSQGTEIDATNIPSIGSKIIIPSR